MSINPVDCSVFIQIWVDLNALNDFIKGIYLVDNNVGSNLNAGTNADRTEGTDKLLTNVPVGTYICWQLLRIDPNSTTSLKIQSFGDAEVFGTTGRPQSYSGSDTIYTGQVLRAVESEYEISLYANIDGGITPSVFPTLVGH
jgi:hypothetical protein